MENVKYILIVSQYYYSHHCFAVSATEDNFREKALTLIEKLEDYKRSEDDQREYSYGYPRDEAYTNISFRWNVNDVGDIYFIPCQSVLAALNNAAEYNSELQYVKKFNVRGMPKKRLAQIEAAVSKHHRYCDIRDIVESIFEIL
ncbi:MAG: hypothetical protein K2H90_02785 [Oscillospiraceae bacterium]|nr:hypothetical protein [Oscillospiraceae bacterium]